MDGRGGRSAVGEWVAVRAGRWSWNWSWARSGFSCPHVKDVGWRAQGAISSALSTTSSLVGAALHQRGRRGMERLARPRVG